MSTLSTPLAALSTPERLTSPTPGGRWLSNGRYSVLLTRAGTGCSRTPGCALTRWNADRIEDRTGLFFFVRDVEARTWFSVGEEPAGGSADSREFATAPGRVTIVRRGDGLEARLDVCVLEGADGELRRLELTNTGDAPRVLDVTSWADVVLNHPAADASHPAFSKLFVQTEWAADDEVLLARRRPRGNDESHPWLVHALVERGFVSCESDRVRFLGREGSPAAPRALRTPGPLGGSCGNVLDPVVALRREVHLPPGRSATFTFVLGLAADRDAALALVRDVRAAEAVERAFAGAAAAERARRAECGIADHEADGLQALAAAAAYGYSGLRAPARRRRGSCRARDCSPATSCGPTAPRSPHGARTVRRPHASPNSNVRAATGTRSGSRASRSRCSPRTRRCRPRRRRACSRGPRSIRPIPTRCSRMRRPTSPHRCTRSRARCSRSRPRAGLVRRGPWRSNERRPPPNRCASGTASAASRPTAAST
ncbi:MAG: hypothetical protein U0704_13700 [Candidatus Eisenbacteria bacterium]